MGYYNPYKHWVVSAFGIAPLAFGMWEVPRWKGASTTTSSMKVRWLPGENDEKTHDFGISNEESDINSFFVAVATFPRRTKTR